MTTPRIARVFVGIVALALPVAAHAKTITVVPGPGTPIQDAIDAATAGDKIRISSGVYDEAIVIDKPLTVAGPRGKFTVIDAGCAAPTAVTIAADGVRLERIVVRRGSLNDVVIAQRSRVGLKDVSTLGPGGPGGCPGTQNGLVVDGGTRIEIRGSGFVGGDGDPPANGYADAAIRIANLADGAEVKLLKSGGHGSVRGLLLENIAAPSKGTTFRVSGGGFADNDTGILLIDVDGARIERAKVFDSATTGVFVDATSDDNRFVRNLIFSDDGVNVSDNGSSNCWLNNNPFATGTVPTGGCP
jgi:nitrous oxidase accessory protein NosD